MTDGVKEIIVEGNYDYKTSFEKKVTASDINYNASNRFEVAEKNLIKKLKKLII